MSTLLQINVTSNWGSTGKIVEAIGNIVIKNGWRSHIAYGRMCNHSSSNVIKIGSKFDNYIHYVYDKFFDMEGLGSKQSTISLINYIKHLNPDIIQLHNIHDHYLNYEVLFKYLNSTNIKIFWTFHDCWAFTGHCYHFVDKKCTKWKTECNDCPKRYKLKDRSRENFILKKMIFTSNKNLTIIACSRWMENLVKESFFKGNQIQVIHNGIDINTFRVLPGQQKKNNIFRIIAVSNVWLPYKGMYDIFKLRSILPDNYEIIMVGVSKKQAQLLPNGIIGIQRTQNVNELVMLYNQSDVLINPTYADTFPTVNLEALACGIPVITYKTCGSPEAIDEKTGIVVEQGNVDELANAIQYLQKHPLSSNDCRKRAEKYFNKHKCFDKYIKLYESQL